MTKKIFVALTIVAVMICGGNVKAHPFADTNQKIAQHLNDADYAIYLAYPTKSDEIFIYNSKPRRSADMIKIFIMASVMDKVKRGEVSLDETIELKDGDKVGGAGILAGYPSGYTFTLREVTEFMITYGDNTATNIIIKRVGMTAINDYIKREGYGDTILRRKMMDFDAIALKLENTSSVRDTGNFFLRLYKHECVGEEYDKIMLDFLLKQKDSVCLPAALPEKKIAHNTGALDGLYVDGGIIYSDSGDAVLVIMTEKFTDKTIAHMKDFARAVVE